MVRAPALPPQQAIGHLPAAADVLRCELPETMDQLALHDRDVLGRMALGAAVLAHDPTALRSDAW